MNTAPPRCFEGCRCSRCGCRRCC
ncbi:hypothetical protein R2601_04223 [Salipiger bermudensis HTCC2601]|uniref:Uncharacterized protein n=1 Tax=Salipiger bermudensis (strain DSM 26914 / JCM 13377 / KCTC 12554 / HTCC2601) TaxID=314265 RepID=Q0FW01_SALBH|nr:hypothetical protein R2601_04223 [Salipiger bermudensis HTCC2601]